MAKEVDFVIVGGGLAGLSAALILRDNNLQRQLENKAPFTYVILESAERLGGRTYSPDPALDFGGGYIGITQTYIQYLLRRFAAEGVCIPTTAQYLEKAGVWLYEGAAGSPPDRYPGDDPLVFPGGSNALQVLGQLDDYALLLRSSLERPWESPLATQFDGMTCQDWIDQQRGLYESVKAAAGKEDPRVGMSEETMKAFVSSVRSAFSLEPREVSFFFLLYYSATAGTYADIVDVAGGDGAAEATRFLLGTQSLVNALANEIGSQNIALNTKVKSIEDLGTDKGLTVTTSDLVWHAKQKVIVAMSPPISKSIQYLPPFESSQAGKDRLELCKQMSKARGRTIKGFVRFKEAYWRDPARDPQKGKGPNLEGQIRQGFLLSVANLTDAPDYATYPLDWTLDNVWENQKRESPDGGSKRCYMMTFIVADAATYWATRDPAERALAVIKHVQSVYGLTDADLYNERDVVSNYSEVNWPVSAPNADTSPDGLIPAPDAMMGPNTLSQVGWALRVPCGNIHWAGSESATEWAGYMNGAVQSGFRAAGEALGYVVPMSTPAQRPPPAMKPQQPPPPQQAKKGAAPMTVPPTSGARATSMRSTPPKTGTDKK